MVSRAQQIRAVCAAGGDLAPLAATRQELESVRWLTFLYAGSALEDAALARNGAALEYMRRVGVCVSGFAAKKIAESLADRPALVAELMGRGLLVI